MDKRGERVEDWKVSPETRSTLKGIRQLQKKIRDYTIAKALIQKRFGEIEQEFMTKSQSLQSMMPMEKDTLRKLQGMNFEQLQGPTQDQQENLSEGY